MLKPFIFRYMAHFIRHIAHYVIDHEVMPLVSHGLCSHPYQPVFFIPALSISNCKIQQANLFIGSLHALQINLLVISMNALINQFNQLFRILRPVYAGYFPNEAIYLVLRHPSVIYPKSPQAQRHVFRQIPYGEIIFNRRHIFK